MSQGRRGDDKYRPFRGICRCIITQNGSVRWFKTNVLRLIAGDEEPLKLENHTVVTEFCNWRWELFCMLVLVLVI